MMEMSQWNDENVCVMKEMSHMWMDGHVSPVE